MDFHSAASIGRGIVLNSGDGIVIGETTIDDEVSVMQGITLGGGCKEKGCHHPKAQRGRSVCFVSSILGNIEIGKGANIGAGSVVLSAVPSNRAVLGVLAIFL